MKNFLLSLIFLFSFQFAIAGEKFNSCEFAFDSEDLHVTWNMSMLGMEINGAVKPKEKIYKNLCDILPSQKMIFRATGKKESGLINERSNGSRHVKIETTKCIFDYYYGIKTDKFVMSNNYNSNCSSSENNRDASNSVTLFEAQSQKAPYGGTQYYSVGCRDKSGGTVHETDIGKNTGVICAGGGIKSVAICKPKNTWSTSLAAKTICGG